MRWLARSLSAASGAGAPPSERDDQASLKSMRGAGVAGARFIVLLPAADAGPVKGAPLLARRA